MSEYTTGEKILNESSHLMMQMLNETGRGQPMNQENSRRVVYIEDDQEMIDLVVLILTRRGFQVKGAHGGRNGLDLIFQDPPDLVLLDLMMPGMDGWEVYQQLKANDKTRNIPVIIVTAKAQAIDRVLGLHIAKVDDYIAKPFRPQELIDSIDHVLNRASQQTTSSPSQ